MVTMQAKEAERFYEDDEDPQEVFAAFDAGRKDLTGPAAERVGEGWIVRARRGLAGVLRRLANVIESPRTRPNH